MITIDPSIPKTCKELRKSAKFHVKKTELLKLEGLVVGVILSDFKPEKNQLTIIHFEDIKSSSRLSRFVKVRDFYSYLLYKYSLCSLKVIGELIDRTHSTIIHETKCILYEMSINKDFKKMILDCESKLEKLILSKKLELKTNSNLPESTEIINSTVWGCDALPLDINAANGRITICYSGIRLRDRRKIVEFLKANFQNVRKISTLTEKTNEKTNVDGRTREPGSECISTSPTNDSGTIRQPFKWPDDSRE